MGLNNLSNEEKLRLVKFVCAFAWADLQVDESERKFVRGLVSNMGLSEDELKKVEGWLDSPPVEDDLDPNEIPDDHRQLFLDAALEMVTADGVVDRMEVENYAIFELLMG